jgi:exopolyphosphatase/pppGpp-phosphohydrolase
MTNILELASSHVEALRNYRPMGSRGTIEILDRLIAEIDRLRPDLASDCVAEPRRLREKLAFTIEAGRVLACEIEQLRAERSEVLKWLRQDRPMKALRVLTEAAKVAGAERGDV